MLKILPISQKVLIKRIKEKETTEGGLYLPEQVQNDAKTFMGTVISCGEGKRTTDGMVVPLQIKEGDVVLLNKYVGNDIDTDHLIVREEEILGVVESI